MLFYGHCFVVLPVLVVNVLLACLGPPQPGCSFSFALAIFAHMARNSLRIAVSKEAGGGGHASHGHELRLPFFFGVHGFIAWAILQSSLRLWMLSLRFDGVTAMVRTSIFRDLLLMDAGAGFSVDAWLGAVDFGGVGSRTGATEVASFQSFHSKMIPLSHRYRLLWV